ncbi:saccharopine dehydrogenase family protein [Herbiconiux daphne]|uniref:Saccharopine dehydrogenase NADP-binding domain-containing protein n=1 Tax=Herbiconiux daphne TaxID=2970914 RepID=A0ABT2H3I7_9MICO|nr:saccharopine dehydrogenase NADP-binding domain-containing protein [Herbiconiux daphne]MCS5734506.1 saccharopine dehydrogenase NADP-binding domain-containing protein [Herbiconiux daphne]
MHTHDIVVYGATGFTGRLVCEYLVERSAELGGLRWAMAGRSIEKLENLRHEIGADGAALLVADTADPASIDAMAASARLVLTTVGPYQLYGSPVVAACAAAGTDYVDLCGEPHWMRAMIDEHSAAARQSGARILFSCGFDSIPSELGVWTVQRAAIERFGEPLPRVRGRLTTFVGGPGGGSMASGRATAEAAADDPAIAALLADPFALTPGFVGPPQPSGSEAGSEPDVGAVRPFFLAPTDVQNVHRSNLLLGHRYGADLVYDEMLVGESAFTPPPGAPLAPGEGPSTAAMNDGSFETVFIGSHPDGRELRAVVASSKDPGFLTTSRMVVETALGLLERQDVAPGVWTPGAALEGDLVNRLAERAFMTFAVLD